MNGLVHNLLMPFFAVGSLKIDVSTSFFLISPHVIDMTTQNDHARYVKHVLGRIYVFVTSFGNWVGGGGGAPKGLVHNVLMQLFRHGQLKKWKLLNPFFYILV